VSSIVEFFIASDDDAAAAVADHGPGPGRDVVSKYGNFDPVSTMGEWEDSFDIVPDHDPRGIAGDGHGVYAVSPSLQAALAAADEEQLEEAAARWTELPSEYIEDLTQEFASDMLNDIADLARAATRRGHRLYYWWG
jgi:hypothetical protein